MSYQLPLIEKLKGSENYDTWKFAVQTYLEHEELWDTVEGTEKDDKKITKARSEIILLVDPLNYVHVQNSKDAKEVGIILQPRFKFGRHEACWTLAYFDNRYTRKK
ncbi:hypothetical protein JTB14_021889 [Gonioctena quinquepunctata]|nr:hypothetical protein JTB14_021889 [Gonioctena quinquepunctata]